MGDSWNVHCLGPNNFLMHSQYKFHQKYFSLNFFYFLLKILITNDTNLSSPHCSTVSAMSFFLAHSGQMMSSPSAEWRSVSVSRATLTCYEAFAHHAGLAAGADEAVVVPVPVLERDEPGATNTCGRTHRHDAVRHTTQSNR